MEDDTMGHFDILSRYEKYLRYMQIMDNMDMMEGVCDSSVIEIHENAMKTNSCKNNESSSKSRSESDADEEELSENDFESDDESVSSSGSLTYKTPKKKVDLDNPYRGLKDSGNPLETMTDVDFLNCYKFSKKTIYDVMELIKNGLIKHTNRGSPVPPLIELLITLKYLTTGSVQKNAMDGVSQSTISRINTRVTKLIVALQNQFIRFPDKMEVERNKMRFYERGKFPDVVGCIGSTHVGVRVKGVKDYNAGFINENGYHSVRVQVHQLMLEDHERMHSYKAAIMQNKDKFKGKIVMDVGAGTGILSVFCALAGAKKVYAIEASEVVTIAKNVVKENNFEDVIEVVHSKIEDFELPKNEKVDVIVSEWMGFYLLHEGMLDSVIHARDKFLKEDGCLYPESATLYMAMCSVPSMYNNWKDVYGVKMVYFGNLLRKSKNNKPEVMVVNEEHLLSDEVALAWINLKDITLEELDCFNIKHVACVKKDGNYQGVCIWFECDFECEYSDYQVILSTSPFNKTTHWKQTVIVLPEEQKVEKGQPIAWELNIKRSEECSRRYDLQLTLLDALDETHPLPCDCYLTTCIVTKKYLQDNAKAESTIEEE